MARAIDSEAAYRFLSEQLVKETGAFSKGVNKGLNIARSAMRNPDAIPTFRPVSREQVEKVWRGEWIGDNDEKVGTIEGSPIKSSTCSACGNWLVGSDEYDCAGYFCPTCGSAMTDEAVQMVMERLEQIKCKN